MRSASRARGRASPPRAALAAGILAALAVCGCPRDAAAAEPPPLVANDYALEIFQGPVIASSRMVGLAGALAPTAGGVEGTASNAAAPAARDGTSRDTFDWDLTGSISFPGAYGGTDFHNRGEKGRQEIVDRTDDFVHANVGGLLQYAGFGVAVTADLLAYDLTPRTTTAAGLRLNYLRGHGVVSRSFLDGQLLLGGGVRVVALDLSEIRGVLPVGTSLVTMLGVSPELGALLMPTDLPFRLGATVRGPVRGGTAVGGTDVAGVRREGPFVLPSSVVLPWEVEIGGAWQVGPRPLNPPWIDPDPVETDLRTRLVVERAARAREAEARITRTPDAERARVAAEVAEQEAAIAQAEEASFAAERARLREVRRLRHANWPRAYLLLTASVVLSGASPGAIALDGFLDQRRERVGEAVTASPRLGVESEVVPHLLRLRVGTYLEPSRFGDGTARQHLTFGTDVRLFAFEGFGLFPHAQWRLAAFADLSARYENFGVGGGLWY